MCVCVCVCVCLRGGGGGSGAHATEETKMQTDLAYQCILLLGIKLCLHSAYDLAFNS